MKWNVKSTNLYTSYFLLHTQMVVEAEKVTIKASDGHELGGTLYRAGEDRTVVIVHGATAVPHRFYRRFAQFMQSQGMTTLTYDFRGIGASAPASLKGYTAQCSDYGIKKLGHMGFFRKGSEPLWQEVVEWLRQF